MKIHYFCEMKSSLFTQRLKPWILPLAMLLGLMLHSEIEAVAFLAPYLIFAMLFITFCRIQPKAFKIDRLSWRLLAVQIGGALLAYLAIRPFSPDVAQGAMICIFCPTATAAPVITGLLGGSVTRLVAYSLLSNISVALLAPIFFTTIGTANINFFQSVSTISLRVVPMILAPLFLALIMRKVWPKAHHEISSRQSISFYVWALSLIIVVGRAVSFVIKEPPAKIPEMLCLAAAAGVACVAQFAIGRRLGRCEGDIVAGGQGLGQKNTVLAVWMALTYLNPISSIAPAAYIAWQNTINSIQIYKHQKQKNG